MQLSRAVAFPNLKNRVFRCTLMSATQFKMFVKEGFPSASSITSESQGLACHIIRHVLPESRDLLLYEIITKDLLLRIFHQARGVKAPLIVSLSLHRCQNDERFDNSTIRIINLACFKL